MKQALILSILSLNYLFLLGQPSIQWQKSFGSTGYDHIAAMQVTSDGGYIAVGFVATGNTDCWIIKYNDQGSIVWTQTIGGSEFDAAYAVQQTFDGGYIVAGTTRSDFPDYHSGNHTNDVFIIKLDSSGSVQWQKCYGGGGDEAASSIKQLSDGSYIIAATTNSFDGDVWSGTRGGFDYWIFRINSQGVLQFGITYGGSKWEQARSIQITSDGGFILFGFSESEDYDVSGNHGMGDFWVLKLNQDYTIQWQKAFGGSGVEDGWCIQKTSDGGYILAGTTNSNDGDVHGNHGTSDIWIIKLTSNGSAQWKKCFGGADLDEAKSIQQTTDGGYIVAGTSYSTDSLVLGNHGKSDFWILGLTSSGNIEWQKCMGGSMDDGSWAIQQTSDGGLVVAGDTQSNDGDVTSASGLSDLWLVKLSSFVGTEEIYNTLFDLSVSPNPVSQSTKISFTLLQKEITFIKVYDIVGREVRTFDKVDFVSGINSFVWDLTDDNGNKIEKGIYILSISTNSFRQNKIIEMSN